MHIVQQLRERGFQAHHRASWQGLYYSFRAGVYIFDCRSSDINYMTSAGAIRVNLWHGIPLKKVERDISDPDHPIAKAQKGTFLQRLYMYLRSPVNAEFYHYVLATSDLVAKRHQSAFGVQADQIINSGYPRNDAFYMNIQDPRFFLGEELKLLETFDTYQSQGERILIYMPTFRDWNNTSQRHIPIDWQLLDECLLEAKGHLYCKLHGSDKASLPVQSFKRIHFIETTIDMYLLLAKADVLISDYSSIFFDFLLLDKPVLFYPYDLEVYQSKSREFYDPYETVTPGPKAYTPVEFNEMIRNVLTNYDKTKAQWQSQRDKICDLSHTYSDGNSSKRLFEVLKLKLKLTK